MPVMQNHAGRTFGRITLSEPVSGKSGYWKGTCSCGRSVEKRIDNLKRPGHHSCGTCLAPNFTANTDLEQRVRRLEQTIAAINPDFLTGAIPAPEQPLNTSVTSEDEEPARSLPPSVTPEASDSVLETRSSQFSRVTYDAEGELWEARSLSGRSFFWGATEEEAAYAARVYLQLIHCTCNRRIIVDAELTLTEARREEIRFEVSEGL